MSKRRTLFWPLAIALPAVLSLSTARAQTDSAVEPVTETPVEVAATDGGADTGGDVSPGTDSGGGTDATTTDAPRDSGGGQDGGTTTDAPRADAGTSTTDDEGDCGCRLGGSRRGSSAALPLAGALAGLGFVIRRRRRR